jgi:hypothetical protein
MREFLPRSIGLILIPCLFIDPRSAAENSIPLAPRHHRRATDSLSPFETQALALRYFFGNGNGYFSRRKNERSDLFESLNPRETDLKPVEIRDQSILDAFDPVVLLWDWNSIVSNGKADPVLKPGARKLLQAIPEEIHQWVLSPSWQKHWSQVELLGLDQVFAGIFGIEMGSPDYLLIENYVVRFGDLRVALITADIAKIAAAKRAGALAFGFAETGSARLRLKAAGSDVIISDFLAIAEILEKLKLTSSDQPDPAPEPEILRSAA